MARDGDDQGGWIEVVKCYKVTQQPDPEVAARAAEAAAAAAKTNAAGVGGALSDVEQRKAALGMSDQTADVVQRRTAGSGNAAFQAVRAQKRKEREAEKTGANDIPLGKVRTKKTKAEREAARAAKVKTEPGAEAADGKEDGSDSEGDSEEEKEVEKEALPELADVKKGRDEQTGFGGWSTVTYETAYTAPEVGEAGHVYKVAMHATPTVT